MSPVDSSREINVFIADAASADRGDGRLIERKIRDDDGVASGIEVDGAKHNMSCIADRGSRLVDELAGVDLGIENNAANLELTYELADDTALGSSLVAHVVLVLRKLKHHRGAYAARYELRDHR